MTPTGGPCRASMWHGFEREDFTLRGRPCVLVGPPAPAPGSPWIWRMEFFGHEPQADLALLAAGLHLAYIDVQDMYGAPVAMDHMDALYAFLTEARGLSAKVALEGFSRGGLFAYRWAALHPERVACIYADAPACDLRAWPAGRGRSPGSPADWEKCLRAYGLSEAELLAHPGNPIDNLQPLADAEIPLLHVCGEADDAAPVEDHTAVLERRYRALGGPISVLRKPFCGHHPHSLRNPDPIVRFVLRHAGLDSGSGPVRAPGTPFGYDYFVPRLGLARCRARFEGQRTGRVAFVTGAPPAAAGWHALVRADLRRRFRAARLEFVAVGGEGADAGNRGGAAGGPPGIPPTRGGAAGPALEAALGGPADLVFADTEAAAASAAEAGRDVALLYLPDAERLAVIRRGEVPAAIAAAERVAERLGLPSLDLAQEVAERIAAGECAWRRDCARGRPSPAVDRVVAAAVGRLLDAVWGAR